MQRVEQYVHSYPPRSGRWNAGQGPRGRRRKCACRW